MSGYIYPPLPSSGDSLPDQTGHAGEFLTTDGSEASWGPTSGGAPTTSTYATITNETGTLPNSRRLAAGPGIQLIDSAGNLTIATTLAASADSVSTIGITMDGGGGVISTGIKTDIYVPYNCQINSVTMLADASGSIVVDIWSSPYSSYPPTVSNSITASAKPTISSSDKSQDSTLSGWLTYIDEGDCLRFNCDSVSSITRCTLVLKVTKL